MNNEYENAMKTLENIFGKDMTLSLATVQNNIPDVRIVDTLYLNQSFYLVTNQDSNKGKQMLCNPNVSLCYRLHRFKGKAINLGNPLKLENKEIRDVLIKEFTSWYFAHANEDNPQTTIFEIQLEEGFTYENKIGYKIDFLSRFAKSFPFDFEIIPLP